MEIEDHKCEGKEWEFRSFVFNKEIHVAALGEIKCIEGVVDATQINRYRIDVEIGEMFEWVDIETEVTYVIRDNELS